MVEPRCVAMCCYKRRAITSSPCVDCRPEYGCLGFYSNSELVQFVKLIPPAMVGAPLPLNLWPKFWQAIEPDAQAGCSSDLTPLRLFASALGLARATATTKPQDHDACNEEPSEPRVPRL
jgi:hypothetical protein